MPEIILCSSLSTDVDNELLTGELSDNSYHFEDELESHINWQTEISMGK